MVYERPVTIGSLLALCLTHSLATARGQTSSKPEAHPQVATYILVENVPYYLKVPKQGSRPDGALMTGTTVVMVRESKTYSRVGLHSAMRQNEVVAFVKTGALKPMAAAKLDRNVTLPDFSTEKGVLARLLIAKKNNPGYSRYDEQEVLKAMKAMKAVVDNRLHYPDPIFFCAPGAQSWFDIITAPDQFQGFSKSNDGQLVISPDIQNLIDDIMMKANTGAPGAYTKFVQNAIDVTNNDVDDPFRNLTMIGTVDVAGGGYGWRTDGIGEPDDSFIKIPDEQGGLIAGNRFYAVAKFAAR
jgi:hypothetical protein